MATVASPAEQTSDESQQSQESKVIDYAKVVEDGASQPQQTAGSEVEKDKAEQPASSEISAAESKEMIENKDEASATEETMKEDEVDVAPASGVVEDKKVDASVVDEIKKEMEGSEASDSGGLGGNKDDASVVEDVEKAAETGQTSSLLDAEVELSVGHPEEKSLSATDSLSEAVEKTPMISSSTSVQESEQVGHEPEVSEPAVEIAETVKESLDVSTTPSLASEAAAKSEEQPVALTVTDPSPHVIGEIERKNETSEGDDILEAPKVEDVAATADEKNATIEGETASELLKEESVVEAGSSASQSLEPVPGDLAEVVAKDVATASENTEKANGDTNADDCQVEATNEKNENSETESLVKEVTVDTSLPSPPISVDEAEAVDTASPDAAVEIAVKPEAVVEEQKGEKTVDVELAKEQKEEKTVEEEPVKEEEQEKVVQIELSLPATKETEVSSEEEKSSQGADMIIEGRDLDVSGSAAQSTEELEKEKAVDVPEEHAEKLKHEIETIENNTTLGQTSTGTDQSEPPIEATEASSEVAKPSEVADMVVEQRDLGVSGSVTNSTENLEKEKAPEVTEELAEEPKHENENIENNTTLTQTSTDILDWAGSTTEVTEASSKEEKPSEGADKVVEQRDLGVSTTATEATENLETEKASEVAEELKHENDNIEDNETVAQTSGDADLGGQTNGTDTSVTEPLVTLGAEKSDVETAEKDETEAKNDAEKSDAQNLVESSKDGDDLKTNLEVQKAEASGKPSKTLMSKVKHSIVKVKKAIIGKSPSSKTMSTESKDELKVK